MKNKIATGLIMLLAVFEVSNAQVGIGTTTPNSTLDVRGSFSANYRAFTTSSTAATDNVLVFTGVSPATLTLPDATTCTGRIYWVKNASSNISVLTIATALAQTIDGNPTWTMDESNQIFCLSSNGANWNIISFGLPSNSGNAWIGGGNKVTALRNIGTKSNFDLPVITNNVERMRMSASGNLAIGTSSFLGAGYTEKLIVDAGVTTSVNAIVGRGNINNYLQLNIQNQSNGTASSSDVVATADNGSETTNYVDMGINGSLNSSGSMGNANDAYFYNIGQNLLIGTGTAAKALVFMTGGTAQASNERMRISGTGNVGIGTNNPGAVLDVSGTYKLGTSGTVLTNMIKTSVAVNDATLFASNVTETVTVAVAGAALNATVLISPRTALPASIGIAWVRVSSANNITIGFTYSNSAFFATGSVGTVTFDVTIIQ